MGKKNNSQRANSHRANSRRAHLPVEQYRKSIGKAENKRNQKEVKRMKDAAEARTFNSEYNDTIWHVMIGIAYWGIFCIIVYYQFPLANKYTRYERFWRDNPRVRWIGDDFMIQRDNSTTIVVGAQFDSGGL